MHTDRQNDPKHMKNSGSIDGLFLCQYVFVNIYITVCPGRSDPFYILTYYINGSLLPGHTVYVIYILYTI